jgi:hypothetical protein
VKLEVDGDPKSGVTLMGTIKAASTKLPLFHGGKKTHSQLSETI